MSRSVLILMVIASTTFGFVNPNTWQIAEDYEVRFTAKNASGTFSLLEGNIIFDPNDLENSSFDMQLDVTSIATGNWLKNRHARGGKWFDADNYPTITFRSVRVEEAADGYKTTGMLKMHGVEREAEIPFTFEADTFKGTLAVLRSDYGVGSTKGLAKKVPDKIVVDLVVPVIRR